MGEKSKILKDDHGRKTLAITSDFNGCDTTITAKFAYYANQNPRLDIVITDKVLNNSESISLGLEEFGALSGWVWLNYNKIMESLENKEINKEN